MAFVLTLSVPSELLLHVERMLDIPNSGTCQFWRPFFCMGTALRLYGSRLPLARSYIQEVYLSSFTWLQRSNVLSWVQMPERGRESRLANKESRPSQNVFPNSGTISSLQTQAQGESQLSKQHSTARARCLLRSSLVSRHRCHVIPRSKMYLNIPWTTRTSL